MRGRITAWQTTGAVLCAWLGLCCGCSSEAARAADPSRQVRYPIGLAADPSGRWVYTLGANFDRTYRAGVLRVIDTHTDTFLGHVGVEIPSFSAGLTLELPSSPTATALRVLATSREDDSVTLVDIAAGTAPLLGCGTLDSNGRCDSAHRYGDSTNLQIGNDPVDLHVVPLDATHSRIHLAATADGRVTILDLDTSAHPFKALPLKYVDHLNFGYGVSAVRASALTGRAYVSSNSANALYVYRVDGAGSTASPYLAAVEPTIVLPAGGLGEYGRGMALSSDGGRLYLAYRSPASVIVVDIAPMANGLPRNSIIDVIGVGRRPSQIAVAPTGPGGSDLLYVTCFGEDAVWVVDPGRGAVVGQVHFKHAPYGVTVAKVPDANGGHWQLYVALFDLHRVVSIPTDSITQGQTTAQVYVKEAP